MNQNHTPVSRTVEEYLVLPYTIEIHRQLATAAEYNGVSLNAYVSTRLAQAVGASVG